MVTKVKGSIFNTEDSLKYTSILDHGADPAGATDSTSAIVAALATGYPVYVPTGTYLTSTITLAANDTIFGDGPSSILKLLDNTNAVLLSLASISFCNLYRFTLDGNKANQAGSGIHAVSINNGNDHQLTDLYIYNSLADGINITGTATSIQITRPRIRGFKGNGVTVGNATDVDINSPRIYASDAAAFPGDGIAVAADAAGSTVSGIFVNGGSIDNCVGRGLAFVGNGSKNVYNCGIRNVYSRSNTSHGFHILTAMQISIEGIARSNGGDGFRLEGDTIKCRIGGIADTNTSFGFREVTSGSSPNTNTFIAAKAMSNGNDAVTTVGGASTILV